MMSNILISAFLAGTLFAIMAGPLGSVVIWRRLAFFGDTLAHGALLGTALGLLLGLPSTLGVLLFSMILATGLVLFTTKKFIAPDTLLAIFAHASLGFGLVALSFSGTVQAQFNQYLFGDVLAISSGDLLFLCFGVVLVLITTWFYWHELLTTIISEELARSEGIPVYKIKLIFMLMLALCVTLALKIIGALLITALLIIPAATARFFAKNPLQMMVLAALFGTLSIGFGLVGSLYFDIPTAPAIVCSAFILFVIARTRQIWA